MSLRTRLTIAGGGAVFAALAIASFVIYADVKSNLHEQIDASLIQSAEGIATKWTLASDNSKSVSSKGTAKKKLLGGVKGGVYVAAPNPNPFKFGPTFAKIDDGFYEIIPSAAASDGHLYLGPLSSEDRAVARGLATPYFKTIRFAGAAMVVYTMRLPLASNGLVRTSRTLTDANATITSVRRMLIALTLGGALAAGVLGLLAANAVLRPVRALAGTVREVSATRELDRRIPVSGLDELSSLAADFNTMLTALEESQRAQQQLIADASHELRTPLTAHRTNIELLARPDLPAEHRQRVLGAAVRSIEELSALVGDLIQASRNGRSLDAREPLPLDGLVAHAVERAQHRAPDLRFASALEPSRTVGSRSRLERAVDNVLDNAIKWSAPGATVEVRLTAGTLTVRDHGPGIAEADLPHVFDRFYRAAAARSLPGSGLGLAIVKQTLDDHGGSVAVANAEGGGALFTLRFPADGNGTVLRELSGSSHTAS